MVLRAEREAYEDLHRAARTAACALRDAPDYADLHELLVRAVRGRLGRDAAVADSPDGGVIGTAPGRRLDFSLRHWPSAPSTQS